MKTLIKLAVLTALLYNGGMYIAAEVRGDMVTLMQHHIAQIDRAAQ